MTPIPPQDELNKILSRDPAYLRLAMKNLTDSVVRRLLGEGTSAFVENELTLAEVLRAVNLGAATTGAKRSLLLVDDLAGAKVPVERPKSHDPFSPDLSLEVITDLPAVPATQAIRDILEREPRLVKTAAQLNELYSSENVFALTRATTLQITEAAQKAIARLMTEGTTVLDASTVLSELGDWSRAYSETVYRTNTASAYTNGMFAMTGDPAVADVIGALRYVATHDSDVRSNHLAYDGLLASPGDPIWHVAAPPQGFNCRCSVELVPWSDIPKDRIDRRTGKITRAHMPSGAYPDPGFKTKSFNPSLAVALAH